MLLNQVIHFSKNFGDQVKGHFPLKTLIEVLYVAHLKIQVLSVNKNLLYFRSVFLDRVTHFRINVGDLGMSFTEKAKIVN